VLSRDERITRLWGLGELRWKLFPDQREVYDAIRKFLDDPATQYESFYVDISRQYGKTFTCVLVADEFARRFPGSQVRYVSTTRVALRKMVHPNMRMLHDDCPRALRPTWDAMDSCYRYPNGSEIHMAGANNGHADDSRGQRAHLVVVEEAGFLDELEYLVSSVLTPQLTTTGGRILFITTPAVTPAHDTTRYRARCEAKGNYIKRTIDDNRHLTTRAKEKLIEECGGRDAPQAQRELWCRQVVDATRAIVPEFGEHEAAIVVEPPVPEWFLPLTTMDVGFQHLHAIGHGWWDFKRAKLVLWDETYLHRATTDKIAAAVCAKEAEHWPWAAAEMERIPGTDTYRVDPWREQRREVVRYSDVDLRLIADLSELHDLPFAATAKDNLEAQINELRILTKNHALEIHPRCKQTIAHLKYGIWNKRRTEFEEAAGFGHFDGVAMMIYMLRNAPRHVNPYPPEFANVDHSRVMVPPHMVAAQESRSAWSSVFGKGSDDE
jgi:hypothetical protein